MLNPCCVQSPYVDDPLWPKRGKKNFFIQLWLDGWMDGMLLKVGHGGYYHRGMQMQPETFHQLNQSSGHYHL